MGGITSIGVKEMNQEEIITQAKKVMCGNYAPQNAVMVRGEGARVYDANGKEYLDFVAGIATTSLGHAHQEVVKAVTEQAEKLFHISNLYFIERQVELATLLTEASFADRVFFCNSGAEANEAAIKLARRYFYEKGNNDRREIISFSDCFHGRTLATIATIPKPKFQDGFDPIPAGFVNVPYNDIKALDKAIGPKTAAVITEIIQGESGVRVPDENFAKELRELTRAKGVLLIVDEVQTGMGRTGKLFAYEHSGITPDIMTLAKALGNGFPIGACLAVEEVANAFKPTSHGSTFGGNPLACASAIATFNVMKKDGFMESVRANGEILGAALDKLKERFPSLIKQVRGIGLMWGMELTIEGKDIVKSMLERGILINCAAGNVIRFVPPLIINEKDIEQVTRALEEELGKLEKESN